MTYRIEKDSEMQGLYYGNFLKSFIGTCSFFNSKDTYIALPDVILKEGDTIEIENKEIITGWFNRKKTVVGIETFKYRPLSEVQIDKGAFEIYRLK